MKEKFRIEYILSSISLNVLWDSISTPTGLADWFADKVSVNGKIYSFTWNNTVQQAELLAIRTGYFIRFHWLGDDPKTYFEFKINLDELTGGVALIITDYADKDEMDDSIELWNNQINELKRKVGI
jgi:hypothetical protein